MMYPSLSTTGSFIGPKATRDAANDLSVRPGLEIQQLSSMATEHPFWGDGAVRARSYEIIWVTAGRGRIQVDGNPFEINDDSIYCLSPGDLRHLQIEKGSQGFYISFNDELRLDGPFQSNLSWLGNSAVSSPLSIAGLDADTRYEMRSIAGQLLKESARKHGQRKQILVGLLNMFVLYMCSGACVDLDVYQTRDKQLVKHFMQLLKTGCRDRKMVREYAAEMNMTPSYLNAVVRRVSGQTASYHIQRQTILEAKRIALHSDRSMKEIAYSLGFDDIAHFSKFFKNNTGTSFSVFKKERAVEG